MCLPTDARVPAYCAAGKRLFNSLRIATISSSGSITLSAGIYSSLVLIMKMWYCTWIPSSYSWPLDFCSIMLSRCKHSCETHGRWNSWRKQTGHAWPTRARFFLNLTYRPNLCVWILPSTHLTSDWNVEIGKKSFPVFFSFFCAAYKFVSSEQQLKCFQFDVKQS